MTVRDEITKPRRETGARRREALRRTQAVRRRSEGRSRRPQACRNSIRAEGRLVPADNGGPVHCAELLVRSRSNISS